MYLKLVSNLLYMTEDFCSSCFSLPSSGITGVNHHAQFYEVTGIEPSSVEI